MSAPQLSVVIPAYNEAARLPATLAAIHAYLGSAGLSHEIVVVDDGSSDDTVARAEALQIREALVQRCPDVKRYRDSLAALKADNPRSVSDA